MRRRDLLIGLGGLGTVLPLAVHAQQKPMPVIGFLSGVSPAPFKGLVDAFRGGLAETGYVEGQTVAIEYRWAEGHYDRLPALAADLIGRKVDVIVATGGAIPAHAAKEATSTIPIVFTTGGDPVAQHLVSSLARPGANLTGFSILVAELMPKRLELLLELVPQAKNIALMVNPQSPNADRMLRELPEVARARGIGLPIFKVATDAEIEAAFAAAKQLKVDALLSGSDAFYNNRRELLVRLAAHYATPAIYDTREFAEAGGLISFGVNLPVIYQQLGVYAGKVLKGAKPADLPVQQPSTFELIVNLKASRALGLTVPQSLLARADEVIE